MPKVFVIVGKASYSEFFRDIVCEEYPHAVIVEATDAKEALEKVDEIEPDLILIFDGKEPAEERGDVKGTHCRRQYLLPAVT